MTTNDAPGLDELLDSVGPRTIIRSVWALRGGGWEACISVPEGPYGDGWYDYTSNQSVGTGPTRIAAIQNAVKSAKEATS